MDCPNCGTYNPENRTQCWKCDELLPVKKETKRRDQQSGRMSPWTWIVLAVLGAVWVLGMCNSPAQTESGAGSMNPTAIVQPLL
ncbi:MAG: hypothetical protein ACYC5O_16450 [Anaerolineae bacterium]